MPKVQLQNMSKNLDHRFFARKLITCRDSALVLDRIRNDLETQKSVLEGHAAIWMTKHLRIVMLT